MRFDSAFSELKMSTKRTIKVPLGTSCWADPTLEYRVHALSSTTFIRTTLLVTGAVEIIRTSYSIQTSSCVTHWGTTSIWNCEAKYKSNTETHIGQCRVHVHIRIFCTQGLLILVTLHIIILGDFSFWLPSYCYSMFSLSDWFSHTEHYTYNVHSVCGINYNTVPQKDSGAAQLSSYLNLVQSGVIMVQG